MKNFWILNGRTYWEKYARFYRILKDSEQLKAIRAKTIEGLDLAEGLRVLDVGCGNGLLIAEIARKVSKVVGLDIEHKMLEDARDNINSAGAFGDNVLLVKGRAESLPFPDNYFDAVNSTLLLAYTADRDAVLREKIRVLRPGGRVAIATPLAGAKFSRVLRAEAKSRNERGELYTRENLIKLVRGTIPAFVFGKIAEHKARTGEWEFYFEAELIEELKKLGLRILRTEIVYAGQAVLVIAEKPNPPPRKFDPHPK